MGFLDFFRRGAVPEPVTPTKGEASFTDSELYTTYQTHPYNPDIFVQRKGGLRVYDRMRRDEMIKSCQSVKKLAVLCSGWNVEPATEENADQEVADFVKEALREIPGTLEEKLKEILTALDFGFSVTEKVWSYLNGGEFAGKLGITLKTRKPHPWDFHTDPHGNLLPKGLWQNQGAFKYDPRKFVVYSHNREFDNWYGVSDLQSVYRPWWSKDVIIKFWNIYMERFGQGGIPMLHGKDGKKVNDPVYSTLRTALQNLQNKSVLTWDTDDAVVELLELKGKNAGEHERAVRYYDRAIGRGLLMPTGLGFSEDEKSGSKARSQTHFNMWLWLMIDFRRIVEETIVQEQIVKDLVDYNYIVKAYPKFKFNPMDDTEKLTLGELWLKAIEGKAVHTNAGDEQHFRRLVEFPERDTDELEAEIEADKEAKEKAREALISRPPPEDEGAATPQTNLPQGSQPGKQTGPELRAAALATYNDDFRARFWEKVDKSGGPNACWLWRGARNDEGYGYFRVGGKILRAARVALELPGRSLGDKVAMHKPTCDKACVNPKHLKGGSRSQNALDHAKRWHRTLTRYEKRVDFAATEKALDALEADTRKRLSATLAKQRDKFLTSLSKAKLSTKWINDISLLYGIEFMSTLKEFLRTGFEMGRRDASGEIAAAKAKKHRAYVLKLPPKKTVAQLEKSAFWIKNVTFQTLTKNIQGVLINAHETGETAGETAMKVRGLYEPYIGDPQVVRDQRQIEPYRIETVVRTNATKAYSRGKVVEFADPELDGFVRAIQLSAILDTRTTETCINADGKIIVLDDEANISRLTPPLHHKCRTIPVGITEADGEFTPSRQLELDILKEQMPPEFGGNFP